MRNFLKNNLLLLVSLIILTKMFIFSSDAFARTKSVYEMESESVYNFIKHVQWPNVKEVRNLCVMNNSPVIAHFNGLVRYNRDKKLKIIVQFERGSLKNCDILFVNKGFEGNVNKLLSRVNKDHSLIIGDIDDFAKNGGMVQFVYRNDRLEIIINSKTLQASKVRIDGNIISVSKIIYK